MNTKIQTALKVGTVAIIIMLTSGCYGELQRQIDSLDARVDDISMAESSAADAAAASAAEARAMAAAAQATADEALEIATLGVACCEATNEKIDRMFQRSQSK